MMVQLSFELLNDYPAEQVVSVRRQKTQISVRRNTHCVWKLLTLLLALCILTSSTVIHCRAEALSSMEYRILPNADMEQIQSASATKQVPTPVEAYMRIIALKSDYPEGMSWTNDNYYAWKGGIYTGGNGCAGFAFLLSDAAFGDLPARMSNEIDYAGLLPGDILRVNSNSHSVIILEVQETGVVIAEGNYNSSIHWGRTLSKDTVLAADYVITRYPENYITVGEFTAEITNNEATVVGWNSSSSWNNRPNLIIPQTIGGYPVTAIGDKVFCSQYFSSIQLPEGLKEIGNQAFYGSRLNGELTIPASVDKIGYYAFSYMNGVTAFHIDGKNQYFRDQDGVLYNNDMTTLLNYPLSKPDTEFTVPESVTLLFCTSFANAVNSEDLYVYSPVVNAMTYTFFNDSFTVWCREGSTLCSQLKNNKLDTSARCNTVDIARDAIRINISDDSGSGVAVIAGYTASGRLAFANIFDQSSVSFTSEMPGTKTINRIKVFYLNTSFSPADKAKTVWSAD